MKQTQLPLIPGVAPKIVHDDDVQRVTEEAIRQSITNANPEWSAFAYKHAVIVAQAKPDFTSDDIDDAMAADPMQNKPVTHDKRAMGAVLLRLGREGKAAKTDRNRPSRRVKLHRSPRAIWVSLCCAPTSFQVAA